tara:strand:- start:106 stop:696 length:591 start_codon:yes stop_codon:yes gene_type:complete
MKATEMLDKIKETLGLELSKEDMQLAKEKLDNGTVIEANAFQENNEVFIVNGSDRIPMPEGSYTMENGQILLVKEEGVIASLGEATEEIKEDEVAEETEDLDESKYATKEEFEALKQMVMDMKGQEASYEDKEDETELSEVKAEVKAEENLAEVEMSAEIVEPIAHNPEALSAPKSNLPQNTNSQLDRIREMIYNN